MKILFYLYLAFILLSCMPKKNIESTPRVAVPLDTGNQGDDIAKTVIDTASSEKPNSSNNVLDSTINNEIQLRNPTSVVNSVGDLSTELISSGAEAPYVILTNKTKNEYLKMTMWYGDPRNSFSYFVVGSNSDIVRLNLHTTKYNRFKTDSGIRLGLSKQDIVNMKGLKYSVTNENSIETISYLGQDLYEAKYHFKKNILVQYEFGYRYP